ncbi:MAG: 5-deoxy-glucuronate isomerase, partial [Ktedonobacterales bacterium]
MQLHYAYDATPGYTQLVTPQTHPVSWLDFGMLRLGADERYTFASGSDEIGLVILTGACSVQIDSQRFEDLGGRSSVFDGRATAVYAPCQAQLQIAAGAGGVEMAICRCQTAISHPARVVRPAEVIAREVGGSGFTRYVHDVLGPQIEASSMLIGETFTVQGNWSSFPPHKHDVEAL